MQLLANTVEQLSGGNVIKQGDETPFRFLLRNENSSVVDLQGATVSIKIANQTIVVLEKTATIDADNVISFSLSQEDIVGYGEMRLEFIVTFPDQTKRLFPADGWQKIKITPSLDNAEVGGISFVTVETIKADIQSFKNEVNPKVEEAVSKSTNAETTAALVQTQLDQVTGASTIDPAVEQMKVGTDGTVYNSPDERVRTEVTKVNAQLAESEKQAFKNAKGIQTPYDYNGAVITFIDDDAKTNFFNIWKQVCDAKGIKVTLAVVPSWLGVSNDAMTLEQLKSLRDEGYDFACHTWYHNAAVFNSTAVDLTTVSDSAIESEYKQGQDWMIENGFPGYDTVVYPWGAFPSGQDIRYKRLARKYFKHGVNASGLLNGSPYDNMYMNRIFLNKNTDIATYKASIDQAETNKSWLIFGTHSIDTEISVAYLTELVEYIIGKNIPIMTFNEALKYKGNALSIGEFTLTKKAYVGHSGIIDMPDAGNLIVKDGFTPSTHNYSMSTLANAFPLNKTILFRLNGANDTLLGVGGTIINNRLDSSNYYNHQLFISESGMFYRQVKSDGTWGVWKPLNQRKIANLTYTVSGWGRNSSYINNIVQDNNTITGNIAMVNASMNGTYTHDQVFLTFDTVNLPALKFIITGTYFTSAGTVEQCSAEISNVNGLGTLKMQGSHSTADLRFLFFNFNYTV